MSTASRSSRGSPLENDDPESRDAFSICSSDDSNDSEGDFGEWLQFVSQCLKGRPNMTAERRKKEEMFEEELDEEETEEERCLRIVKSVLDEETVLEMATDFLEMTRGADVPDWASLSFKSCSFDWEKGQWFLRRSILIFFTQGVYNLTTFINFYMLSLDGKLLNYPEVSLTLLITSGERENTLRKVLAIRNHVPDA